MYCLFSGKSRRSRNVLSSAAVFAKFGKGFESVRRRVAPHVESAVYSRREEAALTSKGNRPHVEREIPASNKSIIILEQT